MHSKSAAAKKAAGKTFGYLVVLVVGFVTIFPLVWLFFASFKTSNEIFGSSALLPEKFSLDAYVNGWDGSGQYTYTTFFVNTFLLVVPTVACTILSSTLVGYGFARFEFPGRKALQMVLISTLMLPNAVLIASRYILFTNLEMINTYLTFIIPALLGCSPFFSYLMVQFFRGIPRELDEAAKIDGCNSFGLLVRILLPLCKPALFSAGLLQFIWTWNDYFNANIYINSVNKYPLSLALRMSLDAQGSIDWSPVVAMSLVAIIPCVLVFFLGQRHFVEGVATSGLKG